MSNAEIDFTPQQYLEAEAKVHTNVENSAKHSFDALAQNLQSPFRFSLKHADCDDPRNEVVRCYRKAENSSNSEVHSCHEKIVEYGKCVKTLQQRHVDLVQEFKLKREALRAADDSK
jgi:hypothetical protein